MERLEPIIATVTGRTPALQRAAAERALKAGAGCVEFRIDTLSPSESPESLLDLAGRRAVIFAGSRRRTIARELEFFRTAQERGAWVDVPYSPGARNRETGLSPRRLILSWHDFERTPDLTGVLREMRRVHAACYKLVPTARDFDDVLLVKRLLLSKGEGGRLCAFAMGTPGVPSRVLALAWGSAAIYASAPGCAAGAPGQMPLEELLSHRPGDLRPDEPLYGLVGWPLPFSMTPFFFNEWLQKRGLPGRYLRIPVKRLEAFRVLAQEIPLQGLAVTLPHKQAILSYLTGASRLVRKAEACNTVLMEGEAFYGVNTDVFGIRRALHSLPKVGLRTLVLGAGGAASAALLALHRRGHCAVAARRPEQARALADRFGSVAIPLRSHLNWDWDLLVNATPVGAGGEGSPVEAGELSGKWVFDMVVRRERTPLAAAAARRGLGVIEGLDMLRAQARLQFKLWTRRNPPRPD
jgi:3-dehydroquinate dehydratase / shikimate dehydrogenase